MWFFVQQQSVFRTGHGSCMDGLKKAEQVFVDQSGNGNFTTIQKAIDSVPANNRNWFFINVAAGLYKEKVKIPRDKPFIVLVGAGTSKTRVEWDDHVSIQTPTFALSANNTVVKSLTFVNTYNLPNNGKVNKNDITPAPAAMIEGDKCAFYSNLIYGTWFLIGISRDSIHKRRATGGKQKGWRKKRKYEMGRQPANTKLSSNKTVRRIRVRGGNVKWRALRLDTGNYSWGSEAVTRKTRVLDVVYNASNNELVRTKTLVKSAIVQVDAAPFKQWYLQHYGVEVGRKKKTVPSAAKKEGEDGEEAAPAAAAAPEEVKKSNHVQRKIESRQEGRSLDSHIEDQFASGRLLACISSRPGQCGRADGYILEGKELEFYQKKIQKKKGKGAA
ncbi:unnamed protein product [Brassica rapa]|uniref:40S ribosomal protein S8 n=2 Tax=Brassica campestris TaxID=3711 RepID=A0A8D9H3Z4_BRACM|nr:unnamed protein product [Brassica rapa]